MPNWCDNTVTITGDKKTLEDFILKSTSDKKFSLNSLYPIPQDQIDNSYNWCVQHWGTKWDVDGASIELDNIKKGSISLNFQTAWSPPLAAFIHISKLFPTLRFKNFFTEEGMDFCGVQSILNDDYFYKEGTLSTYIENSTLIDFSNLNIEKSIISIPISSSTYLEVEESFINDLDPDQKIDGIITLNKKIIFNYLNDPQNNEIELTSKNCSLKIINTNTQLFDKNKFLYSFYRTLMENSNNIIITLEKNKLDQKLEQKNLKKTNLKI